MGELIANLEEYSIYKTYNNKVGIYYLCVPNNNMSICQLYIGFSDKDLNTLSNEDIISTIKDVNDKIVKKDNNSMYIVPDIKISVLEELTNVNDTRDYMRFTSEIIHPIVYEVHEMLVKNKIKKKNINNNIQIITKNDIDRKIAGGLALCPEIGSFMKEISYDSLGISDKIDNGEETLILDEPIVQAENNQDIFSSGIAPVNHEFDNVDNDKSNKNRLVRTRKPTDSSLGFSSFKFIVATLIISLIVGVSIGYLMMR